MTLPRHHASDGEQSRSTETEFVRAQQCTNDDVACELETSVHPQTYASTQAGAHQSAMSVTQSDFPGQTRIFNGGDRRRARSSIVAADGDDVRSRFGHASGDDSNPGARDQFHADSRVRIDRAQIVDQLREIFDAVDVMVRRRRDQAHVRHSVPESRDIYRHLARRKLTALPRLRSLSDLDFQFIRVDQILRGYAKSRGSHLLDAVIRLAAVAVNFRIFSALSSIAATAKPIHGNGERAMCLR